MRICGIDFTSRPKRSKPITCLACTLEGTHLKAEELKEWHSFEQFETALEEPGPWITGIDFPFGQARRFIETIGWPQSWQGYVAHAASLGKAGFEEALEEYAAARPAGDKQHFRIDDRRTNSQSPQKLHFVPGHDLHVRLERSRAADLDDPAGTLLRDGPLRRERRVDLADAGDRNRRMLHRQPRYELTERGELCLDGGNEALDNGVRSRAIGTHPGKHIAR